MKRRIDRVFRFGCPTAAFVPAETGFAHRKSATKTCSLRQRRPRISRPNTPIVTTSITSTENSTKPAFQVPPAFQPFFDCKIHLYSFLFATTKIMNELTPYTYYDHYSRFILVGLNVCRRYSFTFILLRCINVEQCYDSYRVKF